MCIAPIMDEYSRDICHVLEQDPSNFPYEYYAVKFTTFSGSPCAGFRRYLRHLLLDSARIDSDHAAQEYTRAVYGVNVPLPDRYRLENTWRQQKNLFREQHFSGVNNGLETYQFSVRSGARACLETNLDITERAFRFRTGARAGSALSKPSLRCAGGSSRANCTRCCLKSRKITSATSA